MILAAIAAAPLSVTAVVALAAERQPGRSGTGRLAVVLVVDQLRADQPQVFDRPGQSGGFARFFRGGVVYDSARFEHAFTLTAPGHATIFTGAHPSQHGIVANLWYSRAERLRVESVEDTRYPEFGTAKGRSPRMLRVGTVGDRLLEATAGRSKIIAVSGKAHSAILSAGKLGKAFWYEPQAGGFTTSTYYHDQLPASVARWNAVSLRKVPERWTPLPVPDEDSIRDDTDEFERPPAGIGRSFPHALGVPGSPQSLANLRYSPYLDEVTLQFAATLLEERRLGEDADPDLMAISLSGTDYIGHAFGPDSLEMRDNLVRLDRALASFFSLLDEAVGPDNYAVFLTSDHGVVPIPEYQAKRGLPAGRLGMENISREVNLGLRRHFGVDIDLIESFAAPFVYLNFDAARSRGIDREKLVAKAAGLLELIPGIARVVRTDSAGLDAGEWTPLVRNAIDAERSGDLCVLQDPGVYLHDEAGKNATTHGSPYDYDRHVPLMMYGAAIDARRVARPVSPAAIASSLAAYLGIPALASAQVDALAEIAGPTRGTRARN